MAGSAHEKALARARERRAAERAEQRHGLRLVLALLAVLVVAAIALAAVLLTRGGDDVEADAFDPSAEVDDESAATTTDPATDEAAGSAATATPCPAPGDGVPSTERTPYAAQPTVDLAGVESVRAVITTTCGEVVLTLDPAAAPATVANFVALAEDGYYDGVGFHRVIDDFMIQGGDPTGTGTGCLDEACSARLPGYTFADELELAEQVVAQSGGYPRGTLAMANAGPDTNGSQFFIVQADPGYPLPPAYAVFGQVESGMDVVDRIALGPADNQLAIEPVRILGIDVER